MHPAVTSLLQTLLVLSVVTGLVFMAASWAFAVAGTRRRRLADRIAGRIAGAPVHGDVVALSLGLNGDADAGAMRDDDAFDDAPIAEAVMAWIAGHQGITVGERRLLLGIAHDLAWSDRGRGSRSSDTGRAVADLRRRIALALLVEGG